MTELLTAAQMRAIEQAAIESGEVTGLELMERAGRGVVEAILEWRPELAETAHRAVVLCGPGNNGGDGFVVAWLLKERGWEVEVFLYGDEARLPPDAAENCRRWREVGEVQDMYCLYYPIGHLRFAGDCKEKLVIDAVFGIGLKRPIDEMTREVFLALHLDPPRGLVSIDIPTGLSSDTGEYIDFNAEQMMQTWESVEYVNEVDLTVTFHRRKNGHEFGIGPKVCGTVVVKDIGLQPWHARGRKRSKDPKFGNKKDHG